MFRFLVAATATFVVSSAAWAGAGADFCKAMQDQSVACIYEAIQKSNGEMKRHCPDATKAVADAYTAAMTSAKGPMKGELQTANALWLDVADFPVPKTGESKNDYLARGTKNMQSINDECVKLNGLD